MKFIQKLKKRIRFYTKRQWNWIRKGEITRVFEKGFTGENGRKRGQKATGIGLYLCKKLCNKLGLGLELNLKKDVGTEVKIVFPKSSFISETFWLYQKESSNLNSLILIFFNIMFG